MLVCILNKWTYNGNVFLPRELVLMSSELYDHTKDANVAEVILPETVVQVFNTPKNELSDELKAAVDWQEDGDDYHFRVDSQEYIIMKGDVRIAQ